MTSPNYRVRRATLDDIGQLATLWHSMKLPAEDLGRRITEFQVAEGPDGKVLGAIGMQITQRHGRIHSEGFTDFGLAEHLRPLLVGEDSFGGDESRPAPALDPGRGAVLESLRLAQTGRGGSGKLPRDGGMPGPTGSH